MKDSKIERLHLQSIAEEHHQSLLKSDATRKQNQRELRDTLRNMQWDLQIRRQKEREESEKDDAVRRAWSERKARQIKTKREVERRWRLLVIRELYLGPESWKLNQMTNSEKRNRPVFA